MGAQGGGQDGLARAAAQVIEDSVAGRSRADEGGAAEQELLERAGHDLAVGEVRVVSPLTPRLVGEPGAADVPEEQSGQEESQPLVLDEDSQGRRLHSPNNMHHPRAPVSGEGAKLIVCKICFKSNHTILAIVQSSYVS